MRKEQNESLKQHIDNKTNSPMALYNEIWKLGKHHGVDIGPAYNSEYACGVSLILPRNIWKKVHKDITKAKFNSVLCVSSTGSLF